MFFALTIVLTSCKEKDDVIEVILDDEVYVYDESLGTFTVINATLKDTMSVSKSGTKISTSLFSFHNGDEIKLSYELADDKNVLDTCYFTLNNNKKVNGPVYEYKLTNIPKSQYQIAFYAVSKALGKKHSGFISVNVSD